jgi:ferritin-like metal-binding protein YciE
MRSKLRNFDKELKEKSKELETLETILKNKIEQKENLEVNNMSTIISRGKEIIIDKYGNFKGFA